MAARSGSERETKLCATCGRTFQNRHRYGANWAEVRYCSERCRRHKPAALDRSIEHTVLTMLHEREGTICPSEVARALFEDWRPQLERVREAARRLVARGVIEITQQNRVVDPSTARGAIRLRLKK